jgi:hypothetical protein
MIAWMASPTTTITPTTIVTTTTTGNGFDDAVSDDDDDGVDGALLSARKGQLYTPSAHTPVASALPQPHTPVASALPQPLLPPQPLTEGRSSSALRSSQQPTPLLPPLLPSSLGPIGEGVAAAAAGAAGGRSGTQLNAATFAAAESESVARQSSFPDIVYDRQVANRLRWNEPIE